jgi:predicted DNA-binding transcriptional regulator YafY
MRRADRLFQIVQRLRRRGVVTAAVLAESLEVAERTIYRDVADLVASGVPIRGEAGVGYALPKGFDLPPMMFSEEELEALVLGARMVQGRSDAALARAAEGALAKIEGALPERLRVNMAGAKLYAPSFHLPELSSPHLASLRLAVREQRKVAMAYSDKGAVASKRTVWPLGLFYWGRSWSLAAWCELRVDFRSFRVDRIGSLRALDAGFPTEPGKTLADFFARYDSDGVRVERQRGIR